MASELRVLVVDDNDDKRRRVVQALIERLPGGQPYVGEAKNYEEAMERLRDGFFDLVILDLLLPAAGKPPSEDTSRALIHLIMRGTLVSPTYIIGLTEHREVGDREREFYDDNLFALVFYDAGNLDWSDRIVAKIRYLVKSKLAAQRFQVNSYDFDVFVLAARHENEYVPIKKRLFHEEEETVHPIWKGEVTFGSLKLKDGRRLRCGLGCVGEMGMAPTAAMASLAISVFRPRLIAMLGMCCGFSVAQAASPRKFMDAIVVREVSCWEEGKYVDQLKGGNEFRNRAKPRMVDDAIRGAVEDAVERASEGIIPQLRRLATKTEYRRIREQAGADHVREVPEVRFGTLVTGSSVIADEAMVREILTRQPAAMGLDMELYGLYTAVDRSLGRRPSVLGIKAVADYGHAQKDDVAQKGASTVATEVFKAICPVCQYSRRRRLSRAGSTRTKSSAKDHVPDPGLAPASRAGIVPEHVVSDRERRRWIQSELFLDEVMHAVLPSKVYAHRSKASLEATYKHVKLLSSRLLTPGP
jgi:nucleoside phosphorylase